MCLASRAALVSGLCLLYFNSAFSQVAPVAMNDDFHLRPKANTGVMGLPATGWTDPSENGYSLAADIDGFNPAMYFGDGDFQNMSVINEDFFGNGQNLRPLPDGLVHFTPVYRDHDHSVLVQWATTTETNSDFFTIERSKDGREWESLGHVPGAGNSAVPVSYSMVDRNPIYGGSYYRLKQTDFDGVYAHSRVKVIDVGSNGETLLYPSLTGNSFTVQGPAVNGEHLTVYNVLGQDVTGMVQVTPRLESNLISLNTSGLYPGVYIVQVAEQGLKFTWNP